MKFITVDTYKEMSRKAANLIAAQMTVKPASVLGLATGSTPIGIYEELVERCKNGDIDFSAIRSINLDEYVGLDGESDQSYRYFMNHHLFSKVNINIADTYVPNGKAADIEAECKAYDARIEEFGGIDLQLLGIGLDGHIGFNEPDTCFTGDTHLVDLHPSTIEANARFFASKDEVPTKAVTMGMRGIMQAKKVLLVANGPKKKEILEKAFFGPITPEVPASILQLHPDLTVIFSQYE